MSASGTTNKTSQKTGRWPGYYLTRTLLGVSLFALVFSAGCSTKVEKIDTQKLAVAPVKDARLLGEDFDFPSANPSLKRGKEVYNQNCLACHAPGVWQQKNYQENLTYTTPIDMFLFLTTGKAEAVRHGTSERHSLLAKSHGNDMPSFRDSLSRDDRWAAVFYVRYLAGLSDINYTTLDGKPLAVSTVFGANCAVCHGNRGFADGFLHTGKPQKHELKPGGVHSGIFEPPPANFHEYKRFYNRTDAQLFKYISEGVYPSGMPAWLGNVDLDKNFRYDDKMIWMLVRHVRTFSYDNDLSDPVPAGALLPRPASVDVKLPSVPPRRAKAGQGAGEEEHHEKEGA